MKNKTMHSNDQNTFSKWLFAVVLTLSFFNFSGFTISTAPNKQDVQQTSSFANVKSNTGKSLTYKQALKHLYVVNEDCFFFSTSPFHLSKVHTQLLNIKISAQNKPALHIPKTCFFYRLKAAAQSGEDHLIVNLG